MSHRKQKPSGYEARFEEYVDRELHPETAANLKEMVFHSPLGSAEFTMGVILQMQLDHVRKDAELEESATQFDNVFYPQIERTEIAQADFNSRFEK